MDGEIEDYEVAIIACVPWQGPLAHVPGSALMLCLICGDGVAVSPSAQTMIGRYPGQTVQFICLICAKMKFGNEKAYDIPGAKEDVLNRLGPERLAFTNPIEGKTVGEVAADWMRAVRGR